MPDLASIIMSAISISSSWVPCQPFVADVQVIVVDAESGAVLDPFEHLRPRVVEQDDAGGNQHLGAEVGVAAADGFGGVDHRHHTGRDETVGGGAVEVDLIEDGDVARPDATEQSASIGIDPGDSGRTRKFFCGAREQSRHLHEGNDCPALWSVGEARRNILQLCHTNTICCGQARGPSRSARAFATAFGGRSALGLRSRQQLSAWGRPVSESPSPASIRASSATRSDRSSVRTVLVTLPVLPALPAPTERTCLPMTR